MEPSKSYHRPLVTQLPKRPGHKSFWWTRWFFVLHLSTWAIALDQIIKWWMRQNIALGEVYNVTPFLDWVHVWNRGISFGLFPCESLWSRSVLGLVTLIFIGFLVLLCTQSTTTRQRWGSGLMVAGALSNGIDRIFYRGVFDFIRMHWGSWDFPVFNLADMLITMGFLALLSEHFQWNALRLQKKRH